ncbi:polysaccharide pyruvyl transferase family protein [Ancylobacter mangrovi]|uniref:polysaccharide pyruvyl transferase family protein n=1 Tax=Ancylobacter mangrovi TaxID=2972472 RepID=UPI002163327B|nr:polysaccharide pyruvyl transferase family protein [Ancylobacter mangrovi]MCS0500788.1 polysaccharide pyruvyl transferase family protein [Ancylobacter mangrovi]
MLHQDSLRKMVRETGTVPLSWVAATRTQNYLNLGDALSPVMVALLSGKPIVHQAHDANSVRMAAVGTIAQNLKNGDVSVWGTGSSRYINTGGEGERVPFHPDPGTRYRIHATRGPVSRGLLGGEDNAVGKPVYGDPVWALPRFYNPPVEKKWELGVIVHLSDLVDRSLDAQPREAYSRYHIPDEFKDSVRIINTLTEVSAASMREKLDEILSCKRLVSTSLHGMVFAESYGIPCLYFSPRGTPEGLIGRVMDPDDGYDLRITDLYLGLGIPRIPVYVQRRNKPTDWEHLMWSIDIAWKPVEFDIDPLIEALPIDVAPISAPRGQTVFEHPLIRDIPYAHVGGVARARARTPEVQAVAG